MTADDFYVLTVQLLFVNITAPTYWYVINYKFKQISHPLKLNRFKHVLAMIISKPGTRYRNVQHICMSETTFGIQPRILYYLN